VASGKTKKKEETIFLLRGALLLLGGQCTIDESNCGRGECKLPRGPGRKTQRGGENPRPDRVSAKVSGLGGALRKGDVRGLPFSIMNYMAGGGSVAMSGGERC